MREKLLERRLETVKQLSKGLPLNLVVKDLSERYGCTRQAVYHDVKIRSRWLPAVLQLQDREAAVLDLIGAHKELVKAAWVRYYKADNDNAAVGALNLIRKLHKDLFDMTLAPDIMDRLERIEEAAKRQLTRNY